MTSFNSEIISTIKIVFDKSNLGEIHFGEVIQKLISIGIESYFVDYRRGETTYYLPNGENIRHTFESEPSTIAMSFNPIQIKQAIKGAQSGQLMYPQFKSLTYSAGCIGYAVWIKGKNVQYFGRLGENHTEHFPH